MKKCLLFTLFLSLLVMPLLPRSGFPRSPEDSLKEQLLAIAQAAEKEGYELSADLTHVDVMGDDAEESYTLSLDADTEYKIVGICDDDCDDLDLVLYDEKENLISRDSSTDSTPIVDVTPKWTGKFALIVHMASCKDAPCGYAFTILKK